MRHLVVLGLVSFAFVASRADAQDCGCDHVIATGTTIVDGAALGIDPGDVVCVMAGDYEFLRFRAIAGTEAEPVEIRNCGGVVHVRNTDRAYAIVFEDDSHHFHMSGTGAEGATYGFRASCPDEEPWPGVGLWMQGRSTDYEVDHVEVYDTGFAGVMAKTDPLCDGSADQGAFVQRNVHLHDLYVHDTGGEGFYVGSTQANGHTIRCDGVDEVHQPHFLEGIEVDHVIVEDTGWDGMQFGMARSGCSVHDNTIRRVGLERIEVQTRGIQIGSFSGCDVRRNLVADGPTIGIFVLNALSTTVADNVVHDFEDDGIYGNLGSGTGQTYRFVHNTVARVGGQAIRVFGPGLVDSVAWNNLVVGDADAIAAGGDVDWEASGNLIVATEAEAGLYGAGDYHLRETSPARGTGIDRSGAGFALDRDGRARANPPSVGAYEYDADVPLPSPSDSSGCGCVVGGASRGGSVALVASAMLVALIARRRRRDQAL